MAFEALEKTILVVDDEIDLCEILQFDLEDAGFRTFAANHGNEALEVIEREPVDLVISDIRMPGGDGVTLLDELRKRDFQHPPVIFVSGFADISVEEAYHRGVNAIYAKPLCSEKLLETVQFSLTPAMERWKRRSDWGEYAKIKINCRSLEDLKGNHLLSLGRGGMSVKEPEWLPRVGELVYFNCQFESSKSSIEGLGICRWMRNRPRSDAKNRAIGLEFLELNDESIVLVNKYSEAQQLVPYIPMD